MGFDHELADEIIEDTDRDVARFFAGRNDELVAFERAVRVAGRREQTVFHVIQGAPGAGKSSLIQKIRDDNADNPDLVLVDVDKDLLSNVTAMKMRIADELVQGTALAAEGIEAFSDALRVRNLGTFVRRGLEGGLRKPRHPGRWSFGTMRGQNYDARQRDALDHLHKKGLGGGLRAVFLLAGLSPTRSVLAGLGISRQGSWSPTGATSGVCPMPNARSPRG